MTLKECVLAMQMEALTDANFNGLNGQHVAATLRQHHNLWSMMYFGGDEIIVFPMAGRDDELATLFNFDREDESGSA